MEESLEFRLQGAPVSEGIAIGTAFFFYSSGEEQTPEFVIDAEQIETEIHRYRRAILASKEDLFFLKSSLEKEAAFDAIDIIEAHIQMLDDPLLTTHVEDSVRNTRKNIECVFLTVIKEYEKKFSKIQDPFFQQRILDVMDLSKRILNHLDEKKKWQFSEIPASSIVFARELIPSHTAAIQTSYVRAFVTQNGGGNSHAALIARAKGIPYVSRIDRSFWDNIEGKNVIVDGQTGEIIVNPTMTTLERYKEIKLRMKTTHQLLQQDVHYVTETKDGFPVHVLANIGHLSDLEEMHSCRPEGIGLFRSEYLFFGNNTLLISEEEQTRAYTKLIETAGSLSVVIRVFDIGGDKNPDLFFEYEKETNPVLGCRGIRFLLRHLHIFVTQLRAIMKARKGSDVRILLPLVSDLGELRSSKKVIEEVRKELVLQGLCEDRPFPVGCMIEVPSAVLVCDAIAKEADFLSIGTNDLVQYTLGIDRSNSSMSDFCYPAHPSVIRMIKMVEMEAKRQGKSVTICGEIASSPVFIPLLVGLGINQFSCSPRYIPSIKRAIRNVFLLDAYKVAEKVLEMGSPEEISRYLLESYSDPLSCASREYVSS